MQLDVDERRLAHGARGVALTPRAFDVLVYLVRNHGRLISKDELLEKVWARAVVEEASVSVQIAALRKALRDDSRSPRYIETVARTGYRFVAPVTAAQATPRRDPTAVPPRSIAVLPFADMSEAGDQAWFADGLVEEIIGVLSRVEDLAVTARTSAFALRGEKQDVKAIGRALGVRTVLEGSVRRSDGRVRVAVQLVDAENGYQLWSERYDRSVADVFAIQESVASAVADALEVTLGTRAARRREPNLEAYEAYLKAVHFGLKFSPEGFERSRRHYERAIELDARFALAHAGLGQHFFALAGLGMGLGDALPQARACARRALELDPALAEAHVLRGLIAGTYDYDWPAADTAFRAALRHEPRSPWAMDCYGAFYHLQIGDLDNARKIIEAALQLDPLNEVYRVHWGAYLLAAGESRRALAALSDVLDIKPDSWLAHVWSVAACTKLGESAPALHHAERLFALSPIPLAAGVLGGALAGAGQHARAATVLEQLEGDPDANLIPLGLFHLGAGNVDTGLQRFAEALERGERIALLPVLLRISCAASTRWPSLARLLNLPALSPTG